MCASGSQRNFTEYSYFYSPDARPYPLQRLAFNSPSHALDLYTPRYVKGSGSDKVGLCPICIEPISRGGEGTKLFLKTKVSAYSEHPRTGTSLTHSRR